MDMLRSPIPLPDQSCPSIHSRGRLVSWLECRDRRRLPACHSSHRVGSTGLRCSTSFRTGGGCCSKGDRRRSGWPRATRGRESVYVASSALHVTGYFLYWTNFYGLALRPFVSCLYADNAIHDCICLTPEIASEGVFVGCLLCGRVCHLCGSPNTQRTLRRFEKDRATRSRQKHCE